MGAAIQDFPLETIGGSASSLRDYAGKVLLVVNVASKCGLTPQYEGLERIYESYRDRGFEVLGFPANDFRGQEPGSNEEIFSFCTTNYGVQFPMFAKTAVTGEALHPLFQALTQAQPKAQAKPGSDFRARLQGFGIEPNPEPGILWNFEKFVIGRDGEVAARFAPDVPPDDPIIVETLEAELAKT